MTQEQALKILKAGKNVYLTGPAGSGKTFILNEYVNFLKDRNVSVAVTASTGIAATHINGTTIHSWSGMGIKDDLTKYEIDQLVQKESLYKKYEKVKVLVIDEVSMISPRFFDTLDRLTREMKGVDEPFGGIQMILSGDFFQLSPVTRYGEETMYVDASEAWREMDIRICYLAEQHRYDEEDKLAEILKEIRSGEINEDTYTFLESLKEKKGDSVSEKTKLYTHNIDVDEVNEEKLSKIDQEEQIYEIETSGKSGAVASLVKGLLAPEVLKLKKGAIVMFVKTNFEKAARLNMEEEKVRNCSSGSRKRLVDN